MKTVSDQILANLKRVGVRKIFGIPGDTIDTLMESIRKDKEVDFIICRHEANAAFMASGHSRITGELSVVVACQGPGANNLVNGLADAAGDRIPVLAITGQVDSSRIGTGMPQESSQLKLFDDITVFNSEARNVENLMNMLHIGVHSALEKKGVAHISIPSDIMKEKPIDYPSLEEHQGDQSFLQAPENLMEEALERIDKSKKTAILYGAGAKGFEGQVYALSKQLNAPLIYTTRSKELIDNNSPNVIGGIGIMGNHPANKYLHECDLLIILGCNFAFKEFYPNVDMIKVDNNSFRLTAHLQVAYPILSDLGPVLSYWLTHVSPRDSDTFLKSAQKDWIRYIDEFNFKGIPKLRSKYLHPAIVMAHLNEFFQDDAIIVGDSGTTTIWFNNVVQMRPSQRFIWSANLATLGGALGQAIGASFAAPEQPVYVLAGDGGFHMSLPDLITAQMYHRNIVCIILNNSSYGFIEFEERSHDGNVPSGTHFLNPDYAKLAESHGAKGYRVENEESFKEVLQQIESPSGLVVIDCIVDPKAILIPPAVTKEMAGNYIKSEIKSWFNS
ncbi:MAG: thiamine pyrophosphate-binding protein [Flavobacteriaceae bacterium]